MVATQVRARQEEKKKRRRRSNLQLHPFVSSLFLLRRPSTPTFSQRWSPRRLAFFLTFISRARTRLRTHSLNGERKRTTCKASKRERERFSPFLSISFSSPFFFFFDPGPLFFSPPKKKTFLRRSSTRRASTLPRATSAPTSSSRSTSAVVRASTCPGRAGHRGTRTKSASISTTKRGSPRRKKKTRPRRRKSRKERECKTEPDFFFFTRHQSEGGEEPRRRRGFAIRGERDGDTLS